jgi:hypothetical protein
VDPKIGGQAGPAPATDVNKHSIIPIVIRIIAERIANQVPEQFELKLFGEIYAGSDATNAKNWHFEGVTNTNMHRDSGPFNFRIKIKT